MSEESDKDRYWAEVFHIRRSVRYHMRRQAFFDNWHRVTNFVAVLFGSATVITLMTSTGHGWAVSAAVVVTVFAAADLVVGTAQMARRHDHLRRRFMALEQKELLGRDSMTAKQATDLARQRMEVEMEEPPVMRALDTIAHNDVLQAEGFPSGDEAYRPLPLYQRLTAQLVSWDVRLDERQRTAA